MIDPTHFAQPEQIRISRATETKAIIAALRAQVEFLGAIAADQDARIHALEEALAITQTYRSGPLSPITDDCSSGPLSPTLTQTQPQKETTTA